MIYSVRFLKLQALFRGVLNLIGIDLEGVLVPEIWIALAEETGETELKLTTRDIKNYEDLMAHRISILNSKQITAKQLFDIAKSINPFDGAVEFLDKVRKNYQVIILSDTFYNLSKDIFRKLNYPTVFCHTLLVSEDGMISGMNRCINDHKRRTIEAMNRMNFNTLAIGDSYNDLNMLKEAKNGILFRSTEKIINSNPNYISCSSYSDLLKKTFEIFGREE